MKSWNLFTFINVVGVKFNSNYTKFPPSDSLALIDVPQLLLNGTGMGSFVGFFLPALGHQIKHICPHWLSVPWNLGPVGFTMWRGHQLYKFWETTVNSKHSQFDQNTRKTLQSCNNLRNILTDIECSHQNAIYGIMAIKHRFNTIIEKEKCQHWSSRVSCLSVDVVYVCRVSR